MIAPLGATEHLEYLLTQLSELYNLISGVTGRCVSAFGRAGALAAIEACGPHLRRGVPGDCFTVGLSFFRVHVIVFLSLLVV